MPLHGFLDAWILVLLLHQWIPSLLLPSRNPQSISNPPKTELSWDTNVEFRRMQKAFIDMICTVNHEQTHNMVQHFIPQYGRTNIIWSPRKHFTRSSFGWIFGQSLFPGNKTQEYESECFQRIASVILCTHCLLIPLSFSLSLVPTTNTQLIHTGMFLCIWTNTSSLPQPLSWSLTMISFRPGT